MQDKPTQLKLKPLYRHKLNVLAVSEGRSMANMAEWLIDQAFKKSKLKQPQKAPLTPNRKDK